MNSAPATLCCLRAHQEGGNGGSSQSDSLLDRESLKLHSSGLLLPVGTWCLWASWACSPLKIQAVSAGTPVLTEKQCEDVVWGWASGRGGCSVLDSVCPSGWGGCQKGEEEAKGDHPTTHRDLQRYPLQQRRGRWKHQGSDKLSKCKNEMFSLVIHFIYTSYHLWVISLWRCWI